MARISGLSSLTIIIALVGGWASADSPGLIGDWRLNNELTSEVQPRGKDTHSGGLNSVRPSISVGGIPLPTGGGSQGEFSNAPAHDPKVLRCAELTIEHEGEAIRFTYQGAGGETLKPGNVQGTRTRIADRKLTSSYQTTTRKVSKTFELRDDGRLLVTVKLNPKRGATVVHKRVFDRKS
ncbi:MAG: hypothetical protein OES38_09530 [Gammaproteobacteria bacterium]|nr:hypothetical protein [Gammaproteobacteria bacterium]